MMRNGISIGGLVALRTTFAANQSAVIRSFLIDSGVSPPSRKRTCAKIFLHRIFYAATICNELQDVSAAYTERICVAIFARGGLRKIPYFIDVFCIDRKTRAIASRKPIQTALHFFFMRTMRCDACVAGRIHTSLSGISVFFIVL